MIERAAKAMYEAAPGVHPPKGTPQWDWDWMVAEGWDLPDVFRQRARAALQAIRGIDPAAPGASSFRFMIDAILAEGDKTP